MKNKTHRLICFDKRRFDKVDLNDNKIDSRYISLSKQIFDLKHTQKTLRLVTYMLLHIFN